MTNKTNPNQPNPSKTNQPSEEIMKKPTLPTLLLLLPLSTPSLSADISQIAQGVTTAATLSNKHLILMNPETLTKWAEENKNLPRANLACIPDDQFTSFLEVYQLVKKAKIVETEPETKEKSDVE